MMRAHPKAQFWDDKPLIHVKFDLHRFLLTKSHRTKNSPKDRRESFLSSLQEKGVDSAIISDPRHIYYFTGYSTSWPRSTSLLILTREMESYLFVGDSRAADAKKAYDGRLYTFKDYLLS